MELYEYQGKELFVKYNIPIPKGKIIERVDEPFDIGFPCILKAQVPIGGRGKAGGIMPAKNLVDTRKKISNLLGRDLKGFLVKKVLVEEKIDMEKELYLSISLDRSKRSPILMMSSEGGVEIESVADELICKEWINPLIGIQPFHVRRIISRLKLEREISREVSRIILQVYKLFRDYDCELVEINPLAIAGREVKAIDSKVIINDDALFRLPFSPSNEGLTEIEKEAREKGITFIQLDGDIGVIANGAGLTMATLDALNEYGGNPGVFLDLGGTDDPEKVRDAFKLMKKTSPKLILLNLFGGITKCDTVARGVKSVIDEEGLSCPVVARIKGTNEEKAKQILRDAGLITASDFNDAAERASSLEGGK